MAVTVASSSKADWTTTVPMTITAPSGIAVGDILVIYAFGKWNNGGTATSTGFTVVGSATNAAESMTVLAKVADSSDAAAGTFTVTNYQTDTMALIMLRVTGGDAVFTNYTTQQGVTDGVFNTLDVTPTNADSLLLFGMWNVPYTASAMGGYAIVTSNPSWTEEQEGTGNNGFAVGPFAVAWAVRPEITATGDFSITDPGAEQQGIVLVISPVLNVTVSPTVVSMVLTVQAPTVTGGATVSPTVVTATLSIQSPTITITPSEFTNQDKNVESWVNQSKS